MTSSTDDPLVSTDWLAAHIDDPKVKIIDASYKMPGVLPLPIGRLSRRAYSRRGVLRRRLRSPITATRGRICIRAPSSSARDVSALGISSGDTVVAYDSGGWVAAPRAWWMFLSFGHRDVKVLDGGLKKWLREGRPTHSGKVTPKPENSRRRSIRAMSAASSNCLAISKPMPSNWSMRVRGRASRARVAEPLAGPPLRSHSRQPQRALCRVVRCGYRRDEAAGELRRAFTGAGVDMTKPIVTTCGSGVSALVLTLALYRLGVRGSALYDGSWAEWGLPDGPPVATGPA